MKVEAELARASLGKDTLLSAGVFDGVHRGHQYLISRLTEFARQQNLLSAVVTFNRHPQEVLSPQSSLPYLTKPATKAGLLRREGVDSVITLSFTKELSQLSARRFASLLQKHLKMRGLVIGPDFALGRDREGNAATLSKMGKEMGFSVTTIPSLMIDSEEVSSTAIRDALATGNVSQAARQLGRPFSLEGEVVAGAGRGKGLGFPTANLKIDPKQAIPADGVYATRAYLDDRTYPSLTNIGQSPTFGSKERTVEVLIPEYHGNLYGYRLKIDIIERLRGERRFASTRELKEQIAEDAKRGMAILNPEVATSHG